jgi:MYXO-CTERM domain-containing protein
VLRKHYLHAPELPFPQDADGADVGSHDRNGDGVHNIDDWAEDPRLDPAAGVDRADDILDPSDLIATFSDGVDDDGNGYIDDISGWDFFWNDNDPYDDTRYGHGTGEAKDSTAEGDDADGAIGTCPNCMALSLRVSDSFVADGASFASAVLYAVDNGAVVVQEALGTINHPADATQAIEYAWDRDVLVVASAADETAYHHNFPGVSQHTLYVHALRYDEDSRGDSESFLSYSNCTNHGVRLQLSAPSTSCSSGATGVTSGVAGLVASAGLEAGADLSALEMLELLSLTADDVDLSGDPRTEGLDRKWYPTGPGWDRISGYGRINAYHAVSGVLDGDIPPEADLLTPGWFDFIDPEDTATIEITGVARAERDALVGWTLEAGVGDEPETWTVLGEGTDPVEGGVLATWDPDATPLPGLDPAGLLPQAWGADDDQLVRETVVHQWNVTLRLRVEDESGRVGESRKSFTLKHDPDAVDGFPLFMGTSMEGSPNLVDLDGDGVAEIVVGDTAGWVHALRSDGSELSGWPVSGTLLAEVDPDDPANHLGAPAYAVISPERYGSFVGGVAVGDVDGDGVPEVVAADLRGVVHVWSADGQLLPGFPVRQATVAPADQTESNVVDEGFLSSPALGDLDGDGDLEIVLGGMDQNVYAWQHDGSLAAGWPVTPIYPGFEDVGSRIISSPALADLDQDGRVDVAIGTNETLNGTYGATYAISGLGLDDPRGAILPGWPVELFGAYTQALPYVGEGVPGSPAIADMDGDGDLEVATHTIAGNVRAYHHDGSLYREHYGSFSDFGEGSDVWDATIFPFINSSSFGDLDGDGAPDLVTGGIGAGIALSFNYDGEYWRYDHGVLAWSGADGTMIEGFPRTIEDMQFFMNPAVADIDGDGAMEVISGSAGHVVHAWDATGAQPDGWPKLTGHWILGSPAVGDIDGDGLLEVVATTREGWIFAWDTPSRADGPVGWQGWGHDPANTANHEAALPGFNVPLPEDEGDDALEAPVAEGKEGCGCAGAGGAAGGLGLVMLGLVGVVRRRRD